MSLVDRGRTMRGQSQCPDRRGEGKHAKEAGPASSLELPKIEFTAFLHLILRSYEPPTSPSCKSLLLHLCRVDFLILSISRVLPNIEWVLPGPASLWHLPLLFLFLGMLSPEPSWLPPSPPSGWVQREASFRPPSH